MTSTTSISDKAREAASWFETARRATGDTETGPREDGGEFVRVKDGAPEWVTELVYTAHGGDFLPDDWRYEKIREALEFVAEADDPEDSSSEFSDRAVDVYTSARLAWLSSNLNRAGYCDEAVEEFGTDSASGSGIVELIGLGQYYEASEIYSLVLRALEDLAEVES